MLPVQCSSSCPTPTSCRDPVGSSQREGISLWVKPLFGVVVLRVAQGPAASTLPVRSAHSRVLPWTYWSCSPAMCAVTSPPDDSDARSRLKITGLGWQAEHCRHQYACGSSTRTAQKRIVFIEKKWGNDCSPRGTPAEQCHLQTLMTVTDRYRDREGGWSQFLLICTCIGANVVVPAQQFPRDMSATLLGAMEGAVPALRETATQDHRTSELRGSLEITYSIVHLYHLPGSASLTGTFLALALQGCSESELCFL